MKTHAHVAALAFISFSLAPQARADEAKSFDVPVARTHVETSARSPGIVDSRDERADRLNAPIVIEILSVAYRPNRASDFEGSPKGRRRSSMSPPSKTAKRR